MIPAHRYWATAFLVIAGLAIYAIDRGLFVGSATTTSSYTLTAAGSDHAYSVITKTCRYLYITGIAEVPALGGRKDMPGQRLDDDVDTLHCRIFGD